MPIIRKYDGRIGEELIPVGQTADKYPNAMLVRIGMDNEKLARRT